MTMAADILPIAGIGVLILTLFLPMYLASTALLYGLIRCSRSRWLLAIVIAVICLIWTKIFGIPYAWPGTFSSEILAFGVQCLKKWRTHFRPPFELKVQMPWVQIIFWLIPGWALYRLSRRRRRFEFEEGYESDPTFESAPNRFVNADGYVFLSDVGELEHRFMAKQILGRELHSNEIVHHVNGRRTDNQVENLCLMDSEKHEFFHAWLRWKKEKSGRYPTIAHQKRVLEEEYSGTLLEKLDQR